MDTGTTTNTKGILLYTEASNNFFVHIDSKELLYIIGPRSGVVYNINAGKILSVWKLNVSLALHYISWFSFLTSWIFKYPPFFRDEDLNGSCYFIRRNFRERNFREFREWWSCSRQFISWNCFKIAVRESLSQKIFKISGWKTGSGP